MQIKAYRYQEGTKVNIGVNGRVLKNLGTYVLQYCYQLVPINFLQPSPAVIAAISTHAQRP